MPRIIITAQVGDSAKWEQGFRTHGGLFTEYTATAVHFTVTDENEVTILMEVNDTNKFLELVESQATIDAMESDGVNRDSVKISVLDKEVAL